MRILFLIGLGGLIGSILRYLLSLSIQNKFQSFFPFGTLGVNIVGCLAIGIVFGIGERNNFSDEWRLFLSVGICGGFTTFSAFSIETLNMLRDGQLAYAFTYISASIILGLGATLLGIFIPRFF